MVTIAANCIVVIVAMTVMVASVLMTIKDYSEPIFSVKTINSETTPACQQDCYATKEMLKVTAITTKLVVMVTKYLYL